MNLSLRKVTEDDWNYILLLRNNEEYRSFFNEQHIILKNEHYSYLTKQASNKNFFNWIICLNQKDVGYIRILNNDISIIIDKRYHGQGIGTVAIQLVELEAKKLGITTLVGRVMVDNLSSKKIFLKNNFELKMYWFEKNL